MSWDQILPVAVQLPIVFLFIWYSDRLNKQFQDFLREEREARRLQNEAMAKELSEFHSEVSTAIQVMKDRTSRQHRNEN